MRRTPIYCFLLVLTVATAAQAAALTGGSHGQRAQVRGERTIGHQRVGKPVGHRVLFGGRTLASAVGADKAGRAEAFPFTDRSAGTVSSISVFLGSANRATRLIVGLYSGKHGRPGSRLASGSVSVPEARAWRPVSVASASARRGTTYSGSISSRRAGSWWRVPVAPTAVRRGRTYWVAVLGRGGKLYFRVRRDGPCQGYSSHQHHLISLPRAWSRGRRRSNCPISAYATGAAARTPAGAPPKGTAPTRPPGNPGAPGVGGNPGGPGGPGGSGQTEQCFSAPAACGYPDPRASYPAPSYVGPENGATSVGCSSLRPASGTVTLSTPGQIYSGVNLNGRIFVTAANVTIDNVCVTFNGAGTTGTSAVEFEATGGTIENSVVAGANSTNQSVQTTLGENVNVGYTLTANHVYLYNCSECVHNDGWTLANSYVITNGTPCASGYSGTTCQGGADHSEDVYCDSGSETIVHDTLLNPSDQTAAVFCNTNNGGASGPCVNRLTVSNSLLAGGGYIIYSCSNASSAGSSSLTFTNNDIARCLRTPITYQPGTGGTTCGTVDQQGVDSHGYWPHGGYFGRDVYTYCPPTPGVTWSGNFWDDNGASISCI
jgi:hypothetical protein